jgi:hypothetical protein
MKYVAIDRVKQQRRMVKSKSLMNKNKPKIIRDYWKWCGKTPKFPGRNFKLTNHINTYFGSFREFCVEVGIDYGAMRLAVSKRKGEKIRMMKTKMTKKELLDWFYSTYPGRPPTFIELKRDHFKEYRYLERKFGSICQFYEAIGVDYKKVKKYGYRNNWLHGLIWDDKKINDTIDMLIENNCALNSKAVFDEFPGMMGAICRYHVSLEMYLAARGIDYDNVRKNNGKLILYGMEFETLCRRIIRAAGYTGYGITRKHFLHRCTERQRTKTGRKWLIPDFILEDWGGLNFVCADAKLSLKSPGIYTTVKNYRIIAKNIAIIYLCGTRNTDIIRGVEYVSIYQVLCKIKNTRLRVKYRAKCDDIRRRLSDYLVKRSNK